MTSTPSALAARLDGILAAAEGVLRRLPDACLDAVPAGHDRSLCDLGYAVFRESLAFIDAMDGGRLPAAWLAEAVPADMRGSRALASYGALVRARLAGWIEGTGAGEYARAVEVPGGTLSGLALLERTAERAALHLGVLAAAADELGLAPPAPVD
jgi:hypothetical protein